MTAQISDLFRHNGSYVFVAGTSEGALFEPESLGLDPVGACTACYRGYQASFALQDSRLVLDSLCVNLYAVGESYVRCEGPQINGVFPSNATDKTNWFNNNYVGLGYGLSYLGGVLLADEFIDDLYVHGGFHPAWKYRKVTELVFKEGVLQAEFERSQEMEEIRQWIVGYGAEYVKAGDSLYDELQKSMKQSFCRTYSF